MNKRALALWLGLFFYFYSPLEAQENVIPVSGELSGRAGSLWVDDDGYSHYWYSGLALGIGHNFFLSFDLGQVTSNLPWADVSVFGFMGQCGIDTSIGSLTFAAGFFNHSSLNIDTTNFKMFNEGGQGHFFNITAPVQFGFLSITPYLLYGKASWKDGDMYWFFGKPEIPTLYVYGLSFGLDLYDRFKHGIGFYGYSAKIEIISNRNEPLFDSNLNGGLFFYQISLGNTNTEFSGNLGGFFIKAEFEGSLNTSNQPFFLFPYLFYDTSAFYEAQAGFALLRLRHNTGAFRYSFDLGAFHIFNDNGEVDIHYRRKNLFGGKEVNREKSLDFSGFGAAFLSFEVAFLSLPLREGLQSSLGLQKGFIVPWGHGSGGASFKKPAKSEVLSTIKTALLSGLSIGGSISW
jgi:hypothetical protein